MAAKMAGGGQSKVRCRFTGLRRGPRGNRGKFAGAEKMDRGGSRARESLAAFKKSPAAAVPMFNVQSLLGRALVGQKKYAEAETLLVQAYEGLVAHADEIPKTDLRRLAQAGESIVTLYEAWGRPGEAAEWRARVARASRPTPAP